MLVDASHPDGIDIANLTYDEALSDRKSSKLGADTVNKLYLGSNEVVAAYLGGNKVHG